MQVQIRYHEVVSYQVTVDATPRADFEGEDLEEYLCESLEDGEPRWWHLVQEQKPEIFMEAGVEERELDHYSEVKP